MNRFIYIIIIVLTFLMVLQVFPVKGQEKEKEKNWIGKLKDGRVINRDDLEKILMEHKKWLKTNEKEGKQANLVNPVLNGSDLRKANLSGANLSKASLHSVNLSGANLDGAVLFQCNLSGANLNHANLSGDILFEANLSKASLHSVNLSGAYLAGANLSGALLVGKANLSNAHLAGANLSEAYMDEADLSGAVLIEANLDGAVLFRCNLSHANLSHANLSHANLNHANLSEADLRGANLKDCLLYYVKEFPLFYEPKAGSPPYIPSIAKFNNLKKLTFNESPHGLVDLREGFKKLGYREQERAITYAIKYRQRFKLWKDPGSRIWDKLESLSNCLFFEVTCQYGMNPGRPLIILVILIPFFSLFYIIALKTNKKKTGIWLIFLKERVLKATGKERPFRLTVNFPPKPLPVGILNKVKLGILLWCRLIRIAFYFSLISAFSIGWREFNIGNWITRLQQREYVLRPTGWVRTISGIQSLSSVYLLALWILTYFGRPFDTF